MSANTTLINNAVEKLQHIEKSATAKAVKAIPLGFQSLKRGQALLLILLCTIMSIVIVGQNQVLNEVRAWKKESRSTNVMLSNWVTAREKKTQDIIAENVCLQNEMNAKGIECFKSLKMRFEELQQQSEDLRTGDRQAMRRALRDLRNEFTQISLNQPVVLNQ